MFNMGFSELIVLAVIGLLVLGPEQLPTVARKVARLINEFKRATEDVLSPMEKVKKNADQFLNQSIDLNKKKSAGAPSAIDPVEANLDGDADKDYVNPSHAAEAKKENSDGDSDNE